ncbi:hypothetical protein AXF42_Ash011977 [Apostasia shenzhenica]|uniref:Uncharacterized protein n=1 Tax=Apostasia shenzhenica TaxID=1088818 RepID=A0A2I0AJI4_9ASPA|nr:hypothetical protein AXF42_Ash011977 [Apostasia shenzhenica]
MRFWRRFYREIEQSCVLGQNIACSLTEIQPLPKVPSENILVDDPLAGNRNQGDNLKGCRHVPLPLIDNAVDATFPDLSTQPLVEEHLTSEGDQRELAGDHGDGEALCGDNVRDLTVDSNGEDDNPKNGIVGNADFDDHTVSGMLVDQCCQICHILQHSIHVFPLNVHRLEQGDLSLESGWGQHCSPPPQADGNDGVQEEEKKGRMAPRGLTETNQFPTDKAKGMIPVAALEARQGKSGKGKGNEA